VPIDKPQLLGEMLSQGLDHWLRVSAMGTLVITVFDQGYGRVLIA
jgi:hypothetical protein